MTKARMLIAFLVVILLPLTTQAASKSVEQVSREYFAVLQRDGMSAVAPFIHPDALAEFKTMLLPVYEFEARSGQRNFIDATFGTGVAHADLVSMDPEQFMQGVIGLISRQAEEVNLRFDKVEVLGVVEEDEARHVLTRITVAATPIEVTKLEVLSFLPYKESWRLQLNGQMRGIAQALRAQVPE